MAAETRNPFANPADPIQGTDQIVIQQASGTNAAYADDLKAWVQPNVSDFITLDDIIVIQPGKNLFDPSDPDVSPGHYIAATSGVPTVNASYTGSGFMPVVPGTPYSFSPAGTVGTQMAWFNSNKVYISGVSVSSNPLIAPAGASFMRYSILTAYLATFQAEIGYVPTPYDPGTIQVGKTSDGYIYANGVTPTLLASIIAAANGQAAAIALPGMAFPAKSYVLGGYQNTIYFQSVLEKWKPATYNVRINGNLFINESNKARITNPVTEGAVTAVLYDDTFTQQATKTITVQIGLQATNNGALNINVIGDSLAFNGTWLTKVKSLCPALTFVGMRKTYEDASISNEGRGGWTLNLYFTQIQSNIDSFTPFMQPADPYKYYGNTDFWKKAIATPSDYAYGYFNGTSGFNSSTGLRNSPATNDMMWDSVAGNLVVYNGSAWVTTAVTTASFTFNYAKYRSVWGISTPNYVPILLGLNDFRSLTSKAAVVTAFASWKAQMDIVIASIHADTPTAKVVICLPPSFCGSMNNDGGFFTLMQNYMMWQARNLIIQTYDARESSLIYVVDTGSAIDPDYGFDYNSEVPFTDYTGTETRKVDTNVPHPSQPGGYYQLGIPLAAIIQKTR